MSTTDIYINIVYHRRKLAAYHMRKITTPGASCLPQTYRHNYLPVPRQNILVWNKNKNKIRPITGRQNYSRQRNGIRKTEAYKVKVSIFNVGTNIIHAKKIKTPVQKTSEKRRNKLKQVQTRKQNTVPTSSYREKKMATGLVATTCSRDHMYMM